MMPLGSTPGTDLSMLFDAFGAGQTQSALNGVLSKYGNLDNFASAAGQFTGRDPMELKSSIIGAVTKSHPTYSRDPRQFQPMPNPENPASGLASLNPGQGYATPVTSADARAAGLNGIAPEAATQYGPPTPGVMDRAKASIATGNDHRDALYDGMKSGAGSMIDAWNQRVDQLNTANQSGAGGGVVPNAGGGWGSTPLYKPVGEALGKAADYVGGKFQQAFPNNPMAAIRSDLGVGSGGAGGLIANYPDAEGGALPDLTGPAAPVTAGNPVIPGAQAATNDQINVNAGPTGDPDALTPASPFAPQTANAAPPAGVAAAPKNGSATVTTNVGGGIRPPTTADARSSIRPAKKPDAPEAVAQQAEANKPGQLARAQGLDDGAVSEVQAQADPFYKKGEMPGDGSDNGNLWTALIAAGLGTMASKSTRGLGALGEGGLTGLKQFQTERQFDRQETKDKRTLDLQERHASTADRQVDIAAAAQKEVARHNGVTETVQNKLADGTISLKEAQATLAQSRAEAAGVFAQARQVGADAAVQKAEASMLRAENQPVFQINTEAAKQAHDMATTTTTNELGQKVTSFDPTKYRQFLEANQEAGYLSRGMQVPDHLKGARDRAFSGIGGLPPAGAKIIPYKPGA